MSDSVDWSTIGSSALCTYATNYEPHTGEQALTVFKIGRIVVLTGVAQNKIQRDFGDYWYEEPVATVPAGFRPSSDLSGPAMRGSGASLYRIFAKTNGTIGYTQANYGSGTSGGSFPVASYFPFVAVWTTN